MESRPQVREILGKRVNVKQRKSDSFSIFLDVDAGHDLHERWNAFVEEEESYRLSLASRNEEYSRIV